MGGADGPDSDDEDEEEEAAGEPMKPKQDPLADLEGEAEAQPETSKPEAQAEQK